MAVLFLFSVKSDASVRYFSVANTGRLVTFYNINNIMDNTAM